MLALWKDTGSRRDWLHAAIQSASSRLREKEWHIEHPLDMSEEEKKSIKHAVVHNKAKGFKLVACDDIEAGIRIIRNGTVIDATLDGLLKQKNTIEATMIARIKQSAASHE